MRAKKIFEKTFLEQNLGKNYSFFQATVQKGCFLKYNLKSES